MQERYIGAVRGWGREAGFSATAAKYATFGRNDNLRVGVGAMSGVALDPTTAPAFPMAAQAAMGDTQLQEECSSCYGGDSG